MPRYRDSICQIVITCLYGSRFANGMHGNSKLSMGIFANMDFKKLYNQYKDIIPYGVFGVLTTVVNIVSYWLAAHPLGLSVMASTVIAWFLSVLFAYVTNRKWVFHSEAEGFEAIVKEMVSFFGCRLATGFVDLACMFVFVDVLHLDDVVIKVIANVIVIVLNYVASKLVIFKHGDKEDGQLQGDGSSLSPSDSVMGEASVENAD